MNTTDIFQLENGEVHRVGLKCYLSYNIELAALWKHGIVTAHGMAFTLIQGWAVTLAITGLMNINEYGVTSIITSGGSKEALGTHASLVHF